MRHRGRFVTVESYLERHSSRRQTLSPSIPVQELQKSDRIPTDLLLRPPFGPERARDTFVWCLPFWMCFLTASSECRCANVTAASSLLHSVARRFHFRESSSPRRRTIFHTRTRSQGNLKIIQHKVEFYGRHKAPGYALFIAETRTKRCKIIRFLSCRSSPRPLPAAATPAQRQIYCENKNSLQMQNAT